MDKVSSTYEHALAYVYHKIDKRGLFINETKRDALGLKIKNEISNLCGILSTNWNRKVYVGKDNDDGSVDSININATSGKRTLLKGMQELGYEIPKVMRKNKETQEREFKESTCDLALQQMLSKSASSASGPDDNISHVLKIRELNTMYTRYIMARLFKGTYYSNYNVAGTVTGRRGSRKHIFNLGGNAQNFPKHSNLGLEFRECIEAREGRIFFSVDQKSAEDWPVSALANNQIALAEMRSGVNRHFKFASLIFNKPIDQISKDGMEYYLGKKGRHANNYGMRKNTFSLVLAAEGFAISVAVCGEILEKINKADPMVESVFHTYIKEILYAERMLKTPFGRERQFFGLRPNSDNASILNEAYSYIPQSVVGDNTGFAVLSLDKDNDWTIQEGHDSIIQEPPDTEEAIIKCFNDCARSFTRLIRFHNGIEIEIPIEGEIGYNLRDMKKIKDFTVDGVVAAWRELRGIKKDAANTNEVVA